MDFNFFTLFELCLLASSTTRGVFPAWWPTAVVFLISIVNSTLHASGKYDSVFFRTLPILVKALALRISIVLATLLHEMGHLIAAAATGTQLSRDLFSHRNIMGNIECRAWMHAIFPLFPWPMAASFPHVVLSVTSSRAQIWVQLAAPAASVIHAAMCTIFAFHQDFHSLTIVSAIGAWMVALGGIASDLLNAAAASAGEGCIFRCGNFGMLVICAMNRCGIETCGWHYMRSKANHYP